VTTTSSMAFRLTIASQAGRLVPSVSTFTRLGGMFGRATNVLFNGRDDRVGIAAVAGSGGNLYLVAGRTMQKWVLNPDGQRVRLAPPSISINDASTEFLQDFDLQDAIGGALFEEEWGSGKYALEINDLVPYGWVAPENRWIS